MKICKNLFTFFREFDITYISYVNKGIENSEGEKECKNKLKIS